MGNESRGVSDCIKNGSDQFREAFEAEKIEAVQTIVRRDKEVRIKSVGVENRRAKKERQANKIMD